VKSNLKERTAKIIAILRECYADAKCSLDYTNPLELLIATILSAQCTDERVNIVTKSLFKKYKKASDYAQVPQTDLEGDIRSTGFYKNKAKSIQSCTRTLSEVHGGKVPNTLEELVELAGVGRKTANVVLGNAFDIPGIVVDTHVMRLSQRLQLTTNKDPVKIEFDLNALVPPRDWTNFCHWLIWHGRKVCTARKPVCPSCPIGQYCPSKGKV
jgi:endonuclease III